MIFVTPFTTITMAHKNIKYLLIYLPALLLQNLCVH